METTLPCTTPVVHQHIPEERPCVDEDTGRPFICRCCKDCGRWLGDRLVEETLQLH